MISASESVLCRAVHAQGAEGSGVPDLEVIWAHTLGDPGIRIAVLDGPVDRTHPCFRGGAQLVEHATLAGETADNGSASDHGTQIASIIFGTHGSGIDGVAPKCSGLSLPVFSGAKNAPVFCSQLDLARTILQAIDLGAHVINVSGGQLTPSGEADPLLAKAIQACVDNNVLLVAAAGNDGCDCLHVPAALEHVLPVGAMGEDGEPLKISNWGAMYRRRGIVALGENVLAAQPGGGICAKTGTSFATPLVSGVAGLLLSIQLQRGETPDPGAVGRALLAGATPCDPKLTADCRRILAGRLNISGALNLILEKGVTMSEISVADARQEAGLAPSEMPEPLPVLPAQPSIYGVQPSEVSASESVAPIASGEGAASALLPFALRSSPSAPTIRPSDCGCGCGGAACSCGAAKSTQLIYALGRLGYDFSTEARRDTFVQAMPGAAPNPHDPAQLAEYLSANPYEAESLIWTLNLDATPIYAVVPTGPFAASAYERLRTAFEGQLRHGVELVSIPGVIAGNARLLSGQVVPAIVPAIRGMFSWATQPLIESVVGARPRAAEERATYDRRVSGLNNFMSRVYYDLRNLGVTPQDRALNFSATNAFQVAQVMESAAQGDLELDTINVRKSPVCRPDSDCYDIEIGFFDPRNVNVASKIYRFTVDVSDVMPVTIGQVRAWSRRT